MACTTILVGKKASNDNSTMIARNDDGHFDVKKLIVVNPSEQPRKYKTVISHLEIELEDNPMRYTSCPSVDTKNGLWPACGINSLNVGMTATETITSNPRVLGADPLVVYQEAKDGKEEVPGGIGEEDLVTLILPYIKSAREGALRLGSFLEKYGTYEMNGIAFNDENEVWYLETIGGHHWIAKKVEDDEVVIMPNQFGIDHFDLNDALNEGKSNLCSKDLKEFIENNNLDLNVDGIFNPRNIFGSNRDSDHVYNTPRGWYMARYFSANKKEFDGENAKYNPESDNIPWSLRPSKKVTVEDVKYVLSSYYQGTPYNPYSKGDVYGKAKYRSIGINRTGVTALLQIRSDKDTAIKAIEWISFGSNAFNCMLGLYANVDSMPEYVANVSLDTSTDNLYWSSRLIGALADPNYASSIIFIERYQNAVANLSRRLINEFDKKYMERKDLNVLKEANELLCKECKKETINTLNSVLYDASLHMKNGYNRGDN